jgi:hypothetical protein
LLAKTSPKSPLRYVEHVEASVTALFQRVCELDLEGIVAKHKFSPYATEREHSTWFKILNRGYSQKEGREELFERERHSEPVAAFLCISLCQPRSRPLTYPINTPNMFARGWSPSPSDRPDHLALPHRREAGRWWDGCGL